MRVYGEPLIQHLTLDESEYFNKDWDHAARRVMSPPFRDKSHQDSLWAGLQSGSLQVVATDHCAFTTEQKRIGVGNFTKIPNGTGGLEDRLPVLWTRGVETGRLTHERVRRRDLDQHRQDPQHLSARRARSCAGADADIVVWDPKLTKTISAANQQSIIDYNVFEGCQGERACRATPCRAAMWSVARQERSAAARPRPAREAQAVPGSAKALSQWKEITAPRAVTRSAEHMPIGV